MRKGNIIWIVLVTKMDDRAYTMAMATYGLSEIRRKDRLSKVKKPTSSLADKLPIRTFKRERSI